MATVLYSSLSLREFLKEKQKTKRRKKINETLIAKSPVILPGIKKAEIPRTSVNTAKTEMIFGNIPS